MNRNQRLVALVGVVALLWVVRGEMQPGAAPSASTKAKSGPLSPPRQPTSANRAPPHEAAQAWPLRTAMTEAAANPFNPPQPRPVARAGAAQLAPAPVVAAPAQAPAPPETPRAPPLPYRFVGMLTERDAPASVFLALGDRLLLARAGDTLEGGFRLHQITPRELSFLAIPSNLTVRLAVPGEAP